MTALQERLAAAVGAAMRKRGFPASSYEDALKAGLVAGFAVLADELGARPDDAPPVRQLPTVAGSVIVVTDLFGEPVVSARPAVLVPDDGDDGIPWCVGIPGEPGYVWVAPEDITGWVPARVVRDDEQGPVAALRWIAEHQMPDMSLHEQIGALRFKARNALDALGGAP